MHHPRGHVGRFAGRNGSPTFCRPEHLCAVVVQTEEIRPPKLQQLMRVSNIQGTRQRRVEGLLEV